MSGPISPRIPEHGIMSGPISPRIPEHGYFFEGQI